MRLINVNNLQVQEFFGDQIPQYAILSHRWQEGEVSFHEMELDTAKLRFGFAKILQCCDLARQDSLGYIWIDTCCIDKTSSAELTEAINSMYQWYCESAVCYVYLFDVLDKTLFEQSSWFERGWTLQELVAPPKMRFYNSSWKLIGSKKDLEKHIIRATGIPSTVLSTGDLTNCSVALRMSWAAKRITTRGEDIAYSLLGIFSINMPLLYGEGREKAFLRLQEEIVRRSNDQSIFAWSGIKTGGQGLLAPSPIYFADSAAVEAEAFIKDDNEEEEYSITHLGLSIKLRMIVWATAAYAAVLNCFNSSRGGYLTIFLRRTSEKTRQCARVSIGGQDLHYVDESSKRFFNNYMGRFQRILVPQRSWELDDVCCRCSFVIRLPSKIRRQKVLYGPDYRNLQSGLPDDPVLRLESNLGYYGRHVGFILWGKDHFTRAMTFGIDFEFNPVILSLGNLLDIESPDDLDGYYDFMLPDDDMDNVIKHSFTEWMSKKTSAVRGHWKYGLDFKEEDYNYNGSNAFFPAAVSIQRKVVRDCTPPQHEWHVVYGSDALTRKQKIQSSEQTYEIAHVPTSSDHSDLASSQAEKLSTCTMDFPLTGVEMVSSAKITDFDSIPNDEDRERLAAAAKPGTYYVIYTQDSFLYLPEYKKN